MIESAKLRNLINQFQDIEKQIYAFRVARDRLPGDLNNDGILDNQVNSSIVYNNTDFKFPYDGTDTANNHYLPNTCSAPFVELYTEGISNFEPIGQSPSADTGSGVSCRNTAKNGGLPFSNIFKSNFFVIATNFPHVFTQDIPYDQTYIFLQSYDDAKTITGGQARNLDIKFDDGEVLTGKIRAYCRISETGTGSSYQQIINAEKLGGKAGKCSSIMYFY